MLTYIHLVSIVLTLGIVGIVGIYSARYVKNAADFTVGGRNLKTSLVTCSLIGSFIGGTSTIGTAQIGFTLGISGIWFTLGAGLSCIMMGLFLAKPLRNSNVFTIPTFLGTTYGVRAGTWVTFFTSIGMLIQIAAQVLASVPLINSVLTLNIFTAASIVMLLIILYVLFGGIWGTSLVGLMKTFLLYISIFAAGFLCFKLLGGFNGISSSFSPRPWFNLFPHGFSKEIASVFSVIVGFTSTQSYLQIIFSGRNGKVSARGAVFAGLLIPLVGIFCTLIGMFMSVHNPNISPSEALPIFVLKYLDPWFGGIVLATLLISLVMTGAALTLGVSTIWSQNIYKELFRPLADDREILWISRLMVILISVIVILFVTSNANSLILKWAFLSMALRGVTVFLPLLGAVFLKKHMSSAAGTLAVSAAPAFAILWAFIFPNSIDPLYVGMLLSFIILISGMLIKRKFFG